VSTRPRNRAEHERDDHGPGHEGSDEGVNGLCDPDIGPAAVRFELIEPLIAEGKRQHREHRDEDRGAGNVRSGGDHARQAHCGGLTWR